MALAQTSKWRVTLNSRTAKQYHWLPQSVQLTFGRLAKELEVLGPVRGNWKNYGKLKARTHHCHIKSGRPTYVCCWREINEKEIEIFYLGSHANAPY
jgi:hypothetical protein